MTSKPLHVRCVLLCSQKRERFTFAMLHLVHCALARVFVRTPPKKFCAMPKPAAGEMIVGNFHDNFRINRFPFACAVRTPAARSSGRVAGESGWLLRRFKFFC